MSTIQHSSAARPAVTVADQLQAILDATVAPGEASSPLGIAVQHLVEEAAAGDVLAQSATRFIDEEVARLERAISRQLDEVLHHPEYQALEATWRGVEHLVNHLNLGPDVQLTLLNATLDDLIQDDADCQGDVRRSWLYERVVRDEYDTPGGQPYSVVVVGFAFGPSAPHLRALRHAGRALAEGHAVLLGGVSPELFGLSGPSFADLPRHPDDLEAVFALDSHADWRAFRQSPEAKNVGLVMPRHVARVPFGKATRPAPRLDYYAEACHAEADYLFGNPAFLFAERIGASLDEFGWPVRVVGLRGGGKVEGLPVHTYRGDAGESLTRIPTDTVVDDLLDRRLAGLGLLPLSHVRGSSLGVFYGAPSAHQPELTGNPALDADLRTGARLPAVLAANRIGHYLKLMLRDLIGSSRTPAQVQAALEEWLGRYTLANADEASDRLKAERPLQEARVTVEAVEGRPGEYLARVRLVPHWQIEAVGVLLSVHGQAAQQAG